MDARTAARIEALTHAPGWEDLKAELERQEEKFWRRHIADLKDPKIGTKNLDQSELDRALGKLDGIRALLSVPDKAARILLAVNEEGDETS